MRSTERYDGKTRKDDIKKWAPIVALAVVLFIGVQVGLHCLKKAYAPDYTIVDMCNGSLSTEAKELVQEAAAEVIGDKNGNGTVKISFKEVLPPGFGGYDEGTAALFTGDYVLFLMYDPSAWDEDILAEKIDLSDTVLGAYSQLTIYGCILNTDEDDMAEAERIIGALQDMSGQDAS